MMTKEILKRLDALPTSSLERLVDRCKFIMRMRKERFDEQQRK